MYRKAKKIRFHVKTHFVVYFLAVEYNNLIFQFKVDIADLILDLTGMMPMFSTNLGSAHCSMVSCWFKNGDGFRRGLSLG